MFLQFNNTGQILKFLGTVSNFVRKNKYISNGAQDYTDSVPMNNDTPGITQELPDEENDWGVDTCKAST